MTTDPPHKRRLFSPPAGRYSDVQTRVWAIWEIAYTCVDFIAALTFLIGSVMFLSDSWETTGTWLFILGSLCFALKPTIRLVRELHLLRIGDAEQVASKLDV